MRSTSSVLPVPADAKMAMSSSILFATKYRLATPSNKSMTTKRTNANATKNSTGSTQQGLVNAIRISPNATVSASPSPFATNRKKSTTPRLTRANAMLPPIGLALQDRVHAPKA